MANIFVGEKLIMRASDSNSILNDKIISTDKTYSSKKTEERLTEVENTIAAGQEGMVNLWQKTILNTTPTSSTEYPTSSENSLDKLLVQCYKYIEGELGIVATLKEFNNTDKENFYCSDNVQFDTVAKIVDSYNLANTLNQNGLYESDLINKSDFAHLFGIEVL